SGRIALYATTTAPFLVFRQTPACSRAADQCRRHACRLNRELPCFALAAGRERTTRSDSAHSAALRCRRTAVTRPRTKPTPRVPILRTPDTALAHRHDVPRTRTWRFR